MTVKLTDDQRIEGAILHGKIGGFEQVLSVVRTEMLVRGGASGSVDLQHIEAWLVARIFVNRRMLQCLRETGEIPAEAPEDMAPPTEEKPS